MRRRLLIEMILRKVTTQTSSGKDGVDGEIFLDKVEEELNLIERKYQKNKYEFTPYLEKLSSKGRNKKPRVISKPTIRDNITLSYLNEILKDKLGNNYSLPLPNEVVRNVNEEYLELDPAKYSFIKLDIKSFYGSIPKSKLLEKLKPFLSGRELDTITKAVTTATQSFSENKYDASSVALKGIPQGLPISNILASFYLNDFDNKMRQRNFYYFRYVDDILIICTNNLLESIFEYVSNEIQNLKLKLNEKCDQGNLNDQFEYLGYVYNDENVSIRKYSVTQFLRTIFALVSKAEKAKNTSLWGSMEIEKKDIPDILIRNINLKISGAIKGNKKYGWIAYFSQTENISQLFGMDHVIKKKLSEKNYLKKSNVDLKRLVRAYHEFRYNPNNNYALNFDSIKSREQKLKYLYNYGILRLKAGQVMTDKEIKNHFRNFRINQLKYLEQDVGFIS